VVLVTQGEGRKAREGNYTAFSWMQIRQNVQPQGNLNRIWDQDVGLQLEWKKGEKGGVPTVDDPFCSEYKGVG